MGTSVSRTIVEDVTKTFMPDPDNLVRLILPQAVIDRLWEKYDTGNGYVIPPPEKEN